MNFKIKKTYICIIAIVIIAILPYLTNEPVWGDDSGYHLNRIIAIADGLKLGEFPVLIHSNLMNEFGYGSPLFYPDLFLYLPAIFLNLGIELMVSYKWFIAIITFATAIITYYSMNRIFKHEKKSLVITFLYVLSTYRLGDVYVRAALGEIMAFAFVPLIMCGLYEIILGENKKWWIICIGIWGIINSHVLTAIFTLAFILVFCLLNIKKIFKDKQRLINLCIAGIVTDTTFLMEISETNKEFLVSNVSRVQDLLNNNIEGLGIHFSIGPVLLILSFLFIFVKDIDFKKDIFIIQCFGIGVLFLFATTEFFPWKNLLVLSIIQFPYRISIIYTILLSIVATEAIFRFFKNEDTIKMLLLGITLIVFLQLSNVNININEFNLDEIIKTYPAGLEEYRPLNFTKRYKIVCHADDLSKIKFDSKGKIKEESNNFCIDYTKIGSKIEFEYTDQNRNLKMHVPLTYYKGYIAYIIDKNGNKTNLKVEREEKNDNVIVSSDSNITGKVVVKYKMTKLHKISYIITNITFLGLCLYIIINKKCNVKNLFTKQLKS